MKKIILLLFTFHFSVFTLKAQGTWTQKASLPSTGRAYGISFAIGNYGYFGLGGDGASLFYHDFWQYDYTNNTWTRMADFPGKARITPETFVIGNNAYIVMGTDSTYTCINQCWEYNSSNNTWKQKNNFPGAIRAYGIGFSIGNKGFMGTGCYEHLGTPKDFYKDFWEYDTATDTWMREADFGGIARIAANGYAIGNNGFICFGGDSMYAMYNDIWQYDTSNNAWTKKNNCLGTPVYGASGFVIGNSCYVGTGQGGSAYYYNNFWQFNSITSGWSSIPSFLGIARVASSSFEINGKGYLGLGLDSIGNALNDFYEFVPDTLTTNYENILYANNNIALFPNPNNGQFTLSLNYSELVSGTQAIIEVYTVLGVMIYHATLKQTQGGELINLSSQPSGIYLYKVVKVDREVIGEGKIVIQ